MTNNHLPKLIVILGPTASGKTKLAVELARVFNGEIVSADSRQVYKGMDIGTGKDLDEYDNVPYHLIDICEPTEQFSLAQYQKFAYQAIDDIIMRGKIPFLVGGTGLYIQAVIDGYDLSEIKPNEKLRKKLEKKSLEKLQHLIKKNKIELNKSDFGNKRRLIRILEKIECLKLLPARLVAKRTGRHGNFKNFAAQIRPIPSAMTRLAVLIKFLNSSFSQAIKAISGLAVTR